MTPFDHALAALLVVVAPPYTVLSYRRFVRRVAERGGVARGREYVLTMIQHWAITLCALGLFVALRRPLSEIWIAAPAGWGVAIGIGLTTLLVALLFVQLAHVDDPPVREAVLAKLAHVRDLLPHDDADERLFVGLSATAGICEEILYRGFLTWYFAQFLPLYVAVPLCAVAFGLAHAYQGARGVAMTTIVGLVMSGLVLLTGSLWIAMAVHALVDLNSGLMARRALTTRDPSAPARGAEPS